VNGMSHASSIYLFRAFLYYSNENPFKPDAFKKEYRE